MLFGAGAHRKIANFGSRAIRFCKDRRGVAAIEFAFIAPVLLAMYFVTMEVSQGIETNKKVSRIASMVADLVTQQQETTSGALDAIMKIGVSTIQPYNRSTPDITITEITISNETVPRATVKWSRKLKNGVFSVGEKKGDPTPVPDSLKIAGTFLVRVESNLLYQPMITWAADGKQSTGLTAAFDKISMSETYYLRPRMTLEIICKDC